MTESRSLLERLKVLVRKMETDRPVVSPEGLFALMIEHAPVGMLLLDGHGSIVFANQHVANDFRWSREDLIGESIEVLVPKDIREEHVGWRDEVIREGGRRYLRAVNGETKDGESMLMEVGLQTVMLEAGLRYVIVIAARRGERGDVP